MSGYFGEFKKNLKKVRSSKDFKKNSYFNFISGIFIIIFGVSFITVFYKIKTYYPFFEKIPYSIVFICSILISFILAHIITKRKFSDK